MALNIADLFEHAVDAAPDKPALKVGDRVVTYAELEAESNKLAHYLQSQGVGAGDHVAIYAKNSIEHVVAVIAIVKIRAVNINVNYRYVEGELNYLFDNADVVALIHERGYAPIVAACAPKHERLKTFVAVPEATEADVTDLDNDSDVTAYGGVLFADALEGQSAERDFEERSDDDLHIIYTGGTTGFPKGVMWRHEDFWRVLGGGIDFYTGEPLSEFDQSEQAKQDGRMVTFPLSPLMHGGAQAGLLMHLFAGHLTIVEPKFDAQRTWEIIDENGVQLIFMTGDAMARPLIEEFERKAATGTPYDASSLFAVSSSAAIFSPEVKERWIAAFPNPVYTDSVGASETGFQGMGMQDKDHISSDGPVVGLGPQQRRDRRRQPRARRRHQRRRDRPARPRRVGAGRLLQGPGEVGQDLPRGRRRTLLGARRLRPDRGGRQGHLARSRLELRQHRRGEGLPRGGRDGDQAPPGGVRRAGGRHPRREVRPGRRRCDPAARGRPVDLEELRTFLRASLSGYKLPRAMTLVDQIPRNATGKAQYPRAKELALASFAAKIATSPTGA